MARYTNGDKVIDECYFCGISFTEPQALGSRIDCPEDLGCGMSFTIKVSSIKKPEKPKQDSQDE